MRSFQKLTALTEQSVRDNGLELTIELFEMLLKHQRNLKEIPKLRTSREIRTLADFLLIRFSSYLKIDPARLFSNKTSQYSDARCIFFHLLYTYSISSYQELADIMNVSKRTVSYQVRQCKDKIGFPQAQPAFNYDYRELERSVTTFLRSNIF